MSLNVNIIVADVCNIVKDGYYCIMQMIIKTSKKKEIVDITDVVDELLESKPLKQGL